MYEIEMIGIVIENKALLSNLFYFGNAKNHANSMSNSRYTRIGWIYYTIHQESYVWNISCRGNTLIAYQGVAHMSLSQRKDDDTILRLLLFLFMVYSSDFQWQHLLKIPQFVSCNMFTKILALTQPTTLDRSYWALTVWPV